MRKELLLVSGLLIGSMAFAIDPAEIDSLINLKGVVVSANKIHVNRNSVPLSISVIEREEIEASSESALLPVLSERVPGLFVSEKGITGFGVSEGAAGTVNIRGVGQGNKVLMLFDGQPQWAGLFGHSLPDTYVASDVEKVEDTGFADTRAYEWLEAYAAEHGFILRWPQERQAATGMVFEPWHWRYVGRDNALAIRASGLSLEEYLALEQTK